MPNWVDNSIQIKGSEHSLERIKTILTKQNDFIRAQNKGNEEYPLSKNELTFSNILCPPAEIWEEYFMPSGYSSDPELAKKYNNTETGWYEWNNKHWGTKWDACESIVEGEPADGSIRLYFQTAWSPVSDELLSALAEILTISGAESANYWYEEEQGWGGEMSWDRDLNQPWFRQVDEWDIPNSHADYEMRGRDCVCTWNDYMYPDCPKSETEEK